MYPTLRERLQNWTDYDTAMYHLAVVLGVDNPIEETNNVWVNKLIYWSNNPLNRLLDDMIRELAKSGILEYDEEEMMFRWNPNWSLESVKKR